MPELSQPQVIMTQQLKKFRPRTDWAVKDAGLHAAQAIVYTLEAHRNSLWRKGGRASGPKNRFSGQHPCPTNFSLPSKPPNDSALP